MHGGGAEGAWGRGTECMGEGHRKGEGQRVHGEEYRMHGGGKGAEGAWGRGTCQTLKIGHTTASSRSSQESGRVELCIFQVAFGNRLREHQLVVTGTL